MQHAVFFTIFRLVLYASISYGFMDDKVKFQFTAENANEIHHVNISKISCNVLNIRQFKLINRNDQSDRSFIQYGIVHVFFIEN